MTGLLLISFVALAAIGVPIAFSLAAAGILAVHFSLPGTPLLVISSQVLDGIDSFVYVAIPMFVLAGQLMARGGAAKRLIAAANSLFGWLPGGLGISVIIGSLFFSGMVGSKLGEAAAMGATVFPGMERAGYRRRYSVALVAGSSAMGELVPPAVLMIVLATQANQSVGKLFAASLVPAIVMALLLMAVVTLHAHRGHLPGRTPFNAREALLNLLKALPAGIVPLAVFGLFRIGVVTATEAGVVAVLVSLAVTIAYRELPLRELPKVVVDAAATSGMILFVIGLAAVFSYTLSITGAPDAIASAILSISHSATVFMILTCAVIIVVGSVLEGLPAGLIFLPIFFPIAQRLGIDPLHYLVVLVGGISIALFLPPFGIGTAMLSSIAKVSLGDVLRPTASFVVAELGALLVVILIPSLSLFLPNL
jgi:C4-dicarboxylate transporter DctM subunit